MSELTLTVLQLGLLVLLWLFVLGVVGVLRGDLYGTRIAQPQPSRAQRRAREEDPRAQRAAQAAPAPAPRGVPRELVVTEGPLRGTTIALGSSSITIGRAPDATLVIDDEFASGRHARLSPTAGGWIVEDLGSTNGTFLGKDRVVDARQIPPRTPIRVGRTVVELRT